MYFYSAEYVDLVAKKLFANTIVDILPIVIEENLSD